MIELFLDDKPAVLRENVSIKLTKENVYFTKSGSYTYDIELPLQCPENRAIFGSINRKDTVAEYAEFHAVLRVDNVILLDGRAIINSISDTSVKVQLLGGNADMNFYRDGDETYVDELDLGDWMNEVRRHIPEGFEQEKEYGFATGMMYLEVQDMIDKGSEQAQLDYWNKRWWMNEGGDQNTIDRCVAFPVINESADYNAESSNIDAGAIVNGYILRMNDARTIGYPQFRWTWPNEEKSNTDHFPQVIPSFQPMLIMMIRKVLKAMGYPLTEEAELVLLRNTLFRHIFIVTANNRIQLNKALPHWTFNEFLTQIEHFLGIVLEANETTRETNVVCRDEWWSNDPIVIDQVVDEYSVEIDKDEDNDITAGNVGFEDVADGYSHISTDILNAIEIDRTTYTTLYQLRQALYTSSPGDKDKIYEVQGHHFILCKDDNGYYWQEVNQLRMLQRNSEKNETDVQLKIVPCPVKEWKCPVVITYDYRDRYMNDTDWKTPLTITVKVYTRPDVTHIGTDEVSVDTSELDVQALLNDEQELPSSEEGEDKMYVGVIPGGYVTHRDSEGKTYYFPDVVSFPEITIDTLGIHYGAFENQKEFLTLQKYTNDISIKTLYTESLEGSSRINKKVKHCIKFLSNEVINATGMFIINNQRYACEKLEYSITAKGVSPLVTGYFYRMND